jgi:hypothetical protein
MEIRCTVAVLLLMASLGGCSRQDDPTEIPQPETESRLPESNVFSDQARALAKAQRVERTLDAAATSRRESFERQERP